MSESHAETSARLHHACGGGRVFPTDQDRLVAAGEALEIEHHLVRIKFAKDLGEVPLSV